MSEFSIQAEWDDRGFQEACKRLIDAGTRPRPLMADISELLVHSTEDRFEAKIDPEGAPWAPLKASTLARKKKGGILVDEGYLVGSLRPDFGDDFAGVAAGMEYAAIHQLGGRDYMAPGPAAIPARPYMGLSEDDAGAILAAASDYLERTAAGG
jgi:phage virion morphogenesis protein